MTLDHILHIDAPVDVVWKVTEDVDRWPDWTPTVEAARRLDQGAFDVGSTAVLKLPGLPESTWTVTSLTRGERFTWESRVRGIRMVATHEMRPLDASRTESLVRIQMLGPVVVLLWPLLRLVVGRQLPQENTGLQRRSEEIARSGAAGADGPPTT